MAFHFIRKLARSLTLRREYGLPRSAIAQLNQPLSPEFVGERETREGRMVQYLEGWAAIQQANRIFGFDGWGAELIDGVIYHPLRLVDDGGEQLATGIYQATVRVSVKGCLPKTDVGCAFVRHDTPEDHEKALKGAVTDATKRALRHFGEQFGLKLYDKRPQANASFESPTPQRSRPADGEMRRRVIELSGRLGMTEEQALASIYEHFETPLDELNGDQLAEAVGFLADCLNERQKASRERRNGKAPVPNRA